MINLNLYLQRSRHVYDMGFQRCKKREWCHSCHSQIFPKYILTLTYLCGKGNMGGACCTIIILVFFVSYISYK